MNTNLPIYLDYAATTPVDPRVLQVMLPYLQGHYGNPASRSHAFGWAAEEAVEIAREHVAALIGADPREVVWTSGATESNNLAIKGAAQFHQAKGRHLITLKTEHKAVLDTMRELERQGFEVTYLDVQEDGLVNMDALKAAIRPDTILISVMFVNNEIGVIQDIPAIGALYRLTEQHCFGFEFGEEAFFQRFRATDGERQLVMDVQQNPSLLWAGLAYRYVMMPENNVSPILHTVLGGTQIGATGRVMLGLNYSPDARTQFTLGVESSALVYTHQGIWYASPKIGITYGVSLKL